MAACSKFHLKPWLIRQVRVLLQNTIISYSPSATVLALLRKEQFSPAEDKQVLLAVSSSARQVSPQASGAQATPTGLRAASAFGPNGLNLSSLAAANEEVQDVATVMGPVASCSSLKISTTASNFIITHSSRCFGFKLNNAKRPPTFRSFTTANKSVPSPVVSISLTPPRLKAMRIFPQLNELSDLMSKLQILLAQRKASAKIENFDALDLTFRDFKCHFSSLN